MKRFIAIFVLVCTFIGVAALPASAASKGQVLSALETLTEDFGRIQSAAGAKSFTRLSSACDDLGTDALTLYGMSRPKAMSKSSWSHLMTAMDYYMDASEDCVYGADNLDVDSLESSIASLNLGVKEITKARKSL